MISRRIFLTNASALFVAANFMATSALAQGGDDPIPGIDIIIKEDPSLIPVMDASFGRDPLAKLNDMKGQDRPEYITSVVSDLVKKVELDRSFQEDLYRALSSKWSEDYRPDKVTIKARSKDGEQHYTLTVVIKGKR